LRTKPIKNKSVAGTDQDDTLISILEDQKRLIDKMDLIKHKFEVSSADWDLYLADQINQLFHLHLTEEDIKLL
jgi:hypothetical protein